MAMFKLLLLLDWTFNLQNLIDQKLEAVIEVLLEISFYPLQYYHNLKLILLNLTRKVNNLANILFK